MTRYLLSPCCNVNVVVPVDVTAHLLVLGDGRVSDSIADTLKDVRRQAITSGGYDASEAYCAACGASIAAPTAGASR